MGAQKHGARRGFTGMPRDRQHTLLRIYESECVTVACVYVSPLVHVCTTPACTGCYAQANKYQKAASKKACILLLMIIIFALGVVLMTR